MTTVASKGESGKDSQLEKITQSFLRKIKEKEASPHHRDKLKEEIREDISKVKF